MLAPAAALLAAAAVPRLARAARSQRTAAPADPEPSESLCNVEDEYCEELEETSATSNWKKRVRSCGSPVPGAKAPGPPTGARRAPPGPLWCLTGAGAATSAAPGLRRRADHPNYSPCSAAHSGRTGGWRGHLRTHLLLVAGDMLDIGNTGRGPILQLLAMDQSQFMQNFLTVNGLLFTILCGNTYTSLYNQQEILFHALFVEVSEAKSLLEQACLVCQGRPFYPKMLDSIGDDYVSTDLRRLDAEPAELLANRPMDDPLEYILYATSVGVPSIIYDTIRDLRQARGMRLGAMQRKLPAIHFLLLYVLGLLELMAFPLLGAGTFSMAPDEKILSIQALFFGAMAGAIVMTLQVIYELWKPFGGAYTVDTALEKMVRGLEEELRVRKALWQPQGSSQ
ncbi:unnamed protein product [Effrenium voratum]|nr:unnamed protein product [Effrenium voratum]